MDAMAPTPLPPYQHRVSVVMPSVPEQQPIFSAEQLAQLNQHFGPGPADVQNDGNVWTGRAGLDRNSLSNSIGSDGLPRFGQGEFDLLIKGLEMAENQQPDQNS